MLGNIKSQGRKPSPLGELLEKRGINQCQFAEMSGLNRQHINQLVWGLADPTGSTLIKLAKTLNVSTDYLLGLKEQ